MATQDLQSNFTGRDVSLGSTIAKLTAAIEGLGKRTQEVSDRSTRSFASMGSSMGKLHGSIGVLTGGMGALVGSFAAFNVASSIKAAADFEAQMMRLHTQAGVAKDQIAGLSKTVLSLAGPTATAPEQLATALYHVESAGLRGASATQAMTIAAQGAKIGNADLESVTNALTATLVAGIPGAQNMGEAMGSLNAIVGAGDMKMQDLADAMGTGFLASVKNFGVSLNDVGAALATFGDNNVRGADAATQLRMAVLFMAKPVGGAAKVLGDLGMSTTQLAKDMQTGGLIKALKDLKSHMIAAGDTGVKQGAVLVDAFGHKAGTGLSMLVDQLGRVEAKAKQVAAGSQSFGKDWKDTTETAAFKMAKFHETIHALSITLGTNLLPIVAKIADWLGKELPNAIALVKEAFHKLEPIFKWVVGAFGDLVKFVRDNEKVMRPLAIAVGIATAAFIAWNIVLNANPIMLIVTLIGVLVLAFVHAWEHSKTFRDTLISVWNTIEHVVGVVVSKIVEYERGLLHALLSFIGGILHAMAAAFGWLFPGLRDARDKFDQFEKATLDGMQNFADRAANWGVQAGDNFARGVWQGISAAQVAFEQGHGPQGSYYGDGSYTGPGATNAAIAQQGHGPQGSMAADNAVQKIQYGKRSGRGASLQKQIDDLTKGLGANGSVTPGAGAGLDPYGDPLAHGKTGRHRAKGPKQSPAWLAAHKRQMEELRDIWQASHKRQLDALADVQEALKKTAALQKKAETAALNNVKAQVAAFKATVDGFRQTMAQGIQGGPIDIATMIVDPNGQSGNAAWIGINLDEKLAKVTKFADDLKALAKAGAGQDILSQIAGMGPDGGDAAAQSLLGLGPDYIKKITDQTQKIADIAKGSADDITKQFFAPGASAIDQLIAGMQSQYPKLKEELAALAKEVADALGVPVPGGTTPAHHSAGSAATKRASAAFSSAAAAAGGAAAGGVTHIEVVLDGKKVGEGVASTVRTQAQRTQARTGAYVH